MKEKTEFIDEMLHAVQTTENEEVSTWFSDTEKNYNTTQEQIVNQIFGKIYDTLFIKPVSEIKQEILENILYTLLEDTDEVSIRSKHQILANIPETQTILDKKNILTKLVTPSNNTQNTIEGLSVHSELFSHIQYSNNSLLEILSDKEIQKHTRFQSVKPKLKGYMTFDQIEEFKSRVLDPKTQIDFDKQTIIFDENNICQMYKLWILQKQIKPFIINRNTNQDRQELIQKYNLELANNHIQIVDIEPGKIIIKPSNLKKPSDEYIQKTITTIIAKHKASIKLHTQGDNIQIIEDSNDIEKSIQNGFFHFLRDNNIDTTQCSVVDFSPFKKTITIGVTSQEKYKSFDENVYNLKVNHPQKRNNFFGNMGRNFEYVISAPQVSNQKGNLGATIKKILPSKEVSQDVDNSKTFDNAYVLNPTKKEVLIDMIESTQNHIAIIGEKGTGKTHIAHAIANYLKGQKTVVYTTGKDFYHHYQLLSSLDRQHKAKFGQNAKDNQSETFKFKESFKDTNVLIIDGIDYISGTKSATQETIQQIVSKYKLQLIVTSPAELKDITRTQKVQEDGETYKQQSELFNVFDSIQSFHLEQNTRTKEQTLNNLRTEFLQSKKGSTLFSVTEIPYKAREMMVHKINPKRYPSLFTEFYSECARSDDEFLTIIKREIQKSKPEMDEIITSISNIVFESLEDIIECTQSEDLKWSEQMKGRDAQSTRNKILGSTAKNEERKILAIATARIKNIYPKTKLSEIGKVLGNKTSTQVKTLVDIGEDILRRNPKLSTKFSKKISNDFNQKYL